MKIVLDNKSSKQAFVDVCVDDLFVFKGRLYIKLDHDQAMQLADKNGYTNACLVAFNDEDDIDRVLPEVEKWVF